MKAYQEYFGKQPSGWLDIDHRTWKKLMLEWPTFWMDLDVMPNAEALWKLIKPYHPSILTAYPEFWPSASTGKRIWVRKYFPKFGFHPSQQFLAVQREQKRNYAQTNGQPNILIDDHVKNIQEWNAAGGVGVLYTPDAAGLARVSAALAS